LGEEHPEQSLPVFKKESSFLQSSHLISRQPGWCGVALFQNHVGSDGARLNLKKFQEIKKMKMRKAKIAGLFLILAGGVMFITNVMGKSSAAPQAGQAVVKDKEKSDVMSRFEMEKQHTMDFLKGKGDATFIGLYRDSNNATRKLYNKIYEKHPEVRTIPQIADRNAALKKYSKEIKTSHPAIYDTYVKSEKKLLDYLIKSSPRLKKIYDEMTPEQQAQL
jgi:hypothetical protein